MTQKKTGEGAISDEAVKRATGKEWDEWFEILDEWEAVKRSHKEIAQYLHNEHSTDPWWAQTVAVRYEQERGLRVLGERSDGTFQVSVSRTISASDEQIYDAFTSEEILPRWFGDRASIDLREGGRYDMDGGDVGEYRRLVYPKRIRMTWENAKAYPNTVVEIAITPKSTEKSSVTIQHMKLPSEKAREDMREGWSWALTSLKSYLETGKRVTFEAFKTTNP